MSQPKRYSDVKQLKKGPTPKAHKSQIPKTTTERHVEKPPGKRF